ncbi:MAG: molybdenum cofactor guanylyltransferase [Actinomycetes bacterium]
MAGSAHRRALTIDHDLVVLSGGAGRRLGGVPKGDLVLGVRRLLERVIAADPSARDVVIVGPTSAAVVRRDGRPEPIWCREDPPGGGPLAGLAAALPYVTSPVLLVLAVDLPFAAPAVPELLAAVDAPGVSAAVLTQLSGHRLALAAAYRRQPLVDRLGAIGEPSGRPLSLVLDGLDVVQVPDRWGASQDVDTPGDLDRARRRADQVDVTRQTGRGR